MAYANGRLPRSALAPIAQGYLRRDAAAAWNAMNAESRRRYGVTLLPMGSKSSYRDLAGQRYLYRITRRGWAAVPGTSNHGWGTTVDLGSRRYRQIIDQIGKKYGWSKRCSDAQHEWWHIKWDPGCNGAKARWGNVGPYRKPDPYRSLTRREKGLARKIDYHQRERARSKGSLRKRHDKWVQRYAARIRKQMRRLQLDARAKGKGGWKRDNRGARYQALDKSLNR